MEKSQLLKTHGKSKVKSIIGILHNYTEHDTITDHMHLDSVIKKWSHETLEKAFPHIEHLLFF